MKPLLLTKLMTDNNHPITPPPELMIQWQEDWHHSKGAYIEIEVYMAAQAARWGADQELEALLDLADEFLTFETLYDIRAARRPKPPSLKEQALEALSSIERTAAAPVPTSKESLALIRQALEALINE